MGFRTVDIQRNYRHAQRDVIRAAKDRPCADCNTRYPFYVMDLDHRPDEEKLHVVNKMPGRFGIDKIKDEISKCDVVCSNCHRERTHSRNALLG